MSIKVKEREKFLFCNTAAWVTGINTGPERETAEMEPRTKLDSSGGYVTKPALQSCSVRNSFCGDVCLVCKDLCLFVWTFHKGMDIWQFEIDYYANERSEQEWWCKCVCEREKHTHISLSVSILTFVGPHKPAFIIIPMESPPKYKYSEGCVFVCVYILVTLVGTPRIVILFLCGHLASPHKPAWIFMPIVKDN